MNDMTQQAAAQALAEATAESMFARDEASKSLGMTILEVAPGYAKLTMPVRPDMLNGHQTCHGGFIFALADSAFAFSPATATTSIRSRPAARSNTWHRAGRATC